MFESLTQNLNGVFKKLRGKGVISEKNTRDAMREIRMALLEADVSYKVVKDFMAKCQERALGQDVLRSVSPGQQIVKIVNDQLVELMGPGDHTIAFSSHGPTVVMVCGLQGSGKTTTCGKLAKYLQQKGHAPMLVAADVQRPAAIEQLRVLGRQLNVPVYAEEGGRPPRICQRSLKQAREENCDVVILDTAGRLHVDDALMEELQDIRKRVEPHDILFVCDAMTGQDAVTSASEFNDRLGIDGVILTKLDGDARGGAALSVKAVMGKPIKFVGVGEKLENLEEFHPDRMASRILGMGDVVSFVEKIQTDIDAEQAMILEEKIRKRTLTLEDFLGQLQQMKKLGNLGDLMSLMPGMGGVDFSLVEGELPKVEAIIRSMTPHERTHPDAIDSSRRRRIALGSGVNTQQVNGLLKQFRQMKKMMKQLTDGGMSQGMGGIGGAIGGAKAMIGARKAKKAKAKRAKKRPKRRR
jgi:signal recognition particle subunit SRP54